jgi:hypothetical protein
MIVCLLFIAATLAELTVLLFYLFYKRRTDDEKPNEQMIRKIDICAAILHASAFIAFAIVYAVTMMR